MTQTLAAWHPAPDRPGYLRYWDGAQWTEHYSPVPAPVEAATPAVPSRIQLPKQPAARRGTQVVPPRVEELVAGCMHEEPRYPLEEQVEVSGETFYAKGIKRVFSQPTASPSLPTVPRFRTFDVFWCRIRGTPTTSMRWRSA